MQLDELPQNGAGRLFDLSAARALWLFSARNMKSHEGRSSRARLLQGLVTSAILLASAAFQPAYAGGGDELVKQGVEARRQGHDREALDLFKRAFAIDPAPRTQAQMGFAEQALGVWADAEKHLEAAAVRGDDPWIKKNQAVLRKSIEAVASHLGSLEVWGTPAGAEVNINGTPAGTFPLEAPLRLTAGTVSVAVRADGFVELTRLVEVSPGGTARELFNLPKRLITKVAAAPAPAPGASLVGGGRAAGDSAEDRDRDGDAGADEARPVWKRWWFWTAIGAVAVAGGATAFFLLRADDCAAGQMCNSL